MRGKKWLALFGGLLAAALLAAAALTAVIDPFMHYHRPLPGLYYELDNQRSQNDGIIRHFEYEGLITGTSMTENFLASQAEELFGGRFIKVPFEGAQFGETDRAIRAGLENNPGLKIVIRSLDMDNFDADKDAESTDLGSFPEYLYDDNPFNDLNYLLNRDILLGRCMPALLGLVSGQPGGITDFDSYSRWAERFETGAQTVLDINRPFVTPTETVSMDADTERTIRENLRRNVTALPALYPDTEFYYFIPPFSAAYWGECSSEGRLDYTLDMLEIGIDEILSAELPNLRLYGFDNNTELTCDLDKYIGSVHYSADVNSWMLECFKSGSGLISPENREEYMENLRSFYHGFDFNVLFDQLD